MQKNFSKIFFFSSNEELIEKHSKSCWYKRPTIIFYDRMEKNINELLEVKGNRLNNKVNFKQFIH